MKISRLAGWLASLAWAVSVQLSVWYNPSCLIWPVPSPIFFEASKALWQIKPCYQETQMDFSAFACYLTQLATKN